MKNLPTKNMANKNFGFKECRKSMNIFVCIRVLSVIICSALFFALMTEVWVKFTSELTSTGKRSSLLLLYSVLLNINLTLATNKMLTLS